MEKTTMVTYQELKKYPDVFYNFTGLRLTAFYDLLATFKNAYEDDLDERDSQREHERQRERGGGRKGALKTIEDKLVFILFYYKYHPTQKVQARFFGMGQPQALEWVHRLTPIYMQALGHEKHLPTFKTFSVQQVFANCNGLENILK